MRFENSLLLVGSVDPSPRGTIKNVSQVDPTERSKHSGDEDLDKKYQTI